MSLNWVAIGNYTIAILITTVLVLGALHFASHGRVWKTFSENQYKCGTMNLLSINQTPDLTGLYPSSSDAAKAALSCSSPQAFTYSGDLCTLKNGEYVCYTAPQNGKSVA